MLFIYYLFFIKIDKGNEELYDDQFDLIVKE